MPDLIYGVDPTKEVTPVDARNAVTECFYQAQCIEIGLDGVSEEVNRDYCGAFIKKVFKDVQANFEAPTKEDIIKVMNKLAEISAKFRCKEVIQEHFQEVMGLVDKIKE